MCFVIYLELPPFNCSAGRLSFQQWFLPVTLFVLIWTVWICVSPAFLLHVSQKTKGNRKVNPDSKMWVSTHSVIVAYQKLKLSRAGMQQTGLESICVGRLMDNFYYLLASWTHFLSCVSITYEDLSNPIRFLYLVTSEGAEPELCVCSFWQSYGTA